MVDNTRIAKIITLYKPSQLSYLKLAHLDVQSQRLKRARKKRGNLTLVYSKEFDDAHQPDDGHQQTD